MEPMKFRRPVHMLVGSSMNDRGDSPGEGTTIGGKGNHYGASPEVGSDQPKGAFASEADRYIKLPLTPVPVEQGKKGTFIRNWPNFGSQRYPSNIEQWKREYGSFGLALPLGAKLSDGTRLGAIDIDDDRLVSFVEELLGEYPSAKRGKKGITIFVRADAKLKSAAWQPDGEVRWIDALLYGRMTVVPPSIHPETKKPYAWIGRPLYEVEVSSLPLLSKDKFRVLEIVATSEFTPQILSGEATHDATLRLVGKLVFGSDLGDDQIRLLVTALFPPNYQGNSLGEIGEMITSARRNDSQLGVQSTSIDLSVAEEIREKLDPIVFIPGEGFRNYQSGYWRSLPDFEIERIALDCLTSRNIKGQVSPIIRNVIKCLGLRTLRPEFGSYGNHICCQNGTVDVTTGALIEWSPDHELRYQLDFDYDPEAECPTYVDQLNRTIVDDERARETFDEFAGLTLVPEMKYQKALYLMGPAGSGKSALLGVMNSLHSPEAVTVTPLDQIDDQRYLTQLVGKLVVISYDIQTDKKVFGEAFIRITGGDPVTTRRLYAEVGVEARPTARFIGSMNPDLPKFKGDPFALARRLMMIPCQGRITNPDPERPKMLLAERSGILNRWIHALQRLSKRGKFDPPDGSIWEVHDYVHYQDPVMAFIHDRLEASEDSYLTVRDILPEYNEWAALGNERPISEIVLGKKLKAAGQVQEMVSLPSEGGDKKTTRVYRVRWKAGYEPTPGMY